MHFALHHMSFLFCYSIETPLCNLVLTRSRTSDQLPHGATICVPATVSSFRNDFLHFDSANGTNLEIVGIVVHHLSDEDDI